MTCWHLLIVFTLGTILVRSAGCCINDAADREFDKHVMRTAQRPVTSGKVTAFEALALLAFGWPTTPSTPWWTGTMA